jgi:hypothetical protein
VDNFWTKTQISPFSHQNGEFMLESAHLVAHLRLINKLSTSYQQVINSFEIAGKGD